MIAASLSPATGPLLVAALLLVAAGAAKLRRPAPTGLALARTGLPGSDGLVRTLGAGEVLLGAAGLVVGGPTAWLVAAAYLGFAAFVALQLVRARAAGATADCGCFGDLDAPLGVGHLAVVVALALGAAWAAASDAGGLPALGDDAGAAVVVVGLSLVGAVGVRALLTDLPRLTAAMALGSTS